MTRSVNAELIGVARESRRKTQKQLAEDMGISQSKLSKYENGTLAVSDSDLAVLSEATGFTEEFFTQDSDIWGLGTLCVNYRKRASVPTAVSKAIQARLNILRMQLRRLIDGVQIDATQSLPQIDVDEFGGPEAVACEVRRIWKLASGPIKNLTATVEHAGVFVKAEDFGTPKIDAVSQNIEGYPTVLMVNQNSPGDRLRFSIAHELGHVIMHENSSANIEDEANRFAAELLMPSAEIGPSLRNISLDKLANLKCKWRVSMQALIKRAADLGRISERHSRTLFMQMGKHGWRIREPINVDVERPTVIRQVLRVHVDDHGYSVSDLARAAYLRKSDDFVRQFGYHESGGLRVVG